MTRSFCVAIAGWIGLSVHLTCSGATFAAPFTDGCVLQRGVPVSIWGTAAAGETVNVSFGGQNASTVAGGDGKWLVRLAPMEACSEGRVLAANDCRVKDVLVGEVWLCSGQSNAALPLCGADPRFRDKTGALVAAMTRKPLVRFASTSGEPWCEKPRTTPVRPIAWKAFTPENLGKGGAFSALGAYFALEIHAALGVPVGVIGAYQGSSPIESWIPPEAFASRPKLKGYPAFPPVAPDAWTRGMTNSFVRYGGFQQPCVLWNARIAPLVPYTVKGVVWYQGCSNQWNPERYLDLQHALYESWARAFGNPDLPFRFVQVASWGWTGGSTLPIQLSQEQFAREERNAAMAVISDIGNRSDAHPNEKGLAAKRLAALALERDYGFAGLRADSPTLRTWHAEGNVAVLTFDHARTMYLYNPDNSLSSTFEVSGADGKWVAANVLNAETKGTRRGAFPANEIRLSAPGVERPVAVRYLHREPYDGNVFNEMDLPLGAFSVAAPRKFVDVSRVCPRYFEDDKGKTWIPVGINMCYAHPPEATAVDVPEAEFLASYERWMRAFAANGGNYIRIFLCRPTVDVLTDKPGVWNERAADNLWKIVHLAEELGIKVKFTFEVFRMVIPEAEATTDYKKKLNKSFYLPYAKSMHEFFHSAECERLFLDKARYYAKKGFGDSPAVICWEPWNEVDSTGPIADYALWSARVQGELRKIFPRQMVTQNLGSFASPGSVLVYDQLGTAEPNDFMQVHRYLDPGANMDVCRGPMDVLCADAVRELLDRRSDKPALLAETGSVEAHHSGPSHLMALDKEGTMLHDALFAPFFAGAAGTGCNWHWAIYVEDNNLWYHFARFRKAIEGLDPAAEDFRPFHLETHALRVWGLKGKKTTVLWLRDKASDWSSELDKGVAARQLGGNRLPFATDVPAQWYLPWEDRTVETPPGALVAPKFRRSAVVRFPTCRKE